jgi:hypothetical protein
MGLVVRVLSLSVPHPLAEQSQGGRGEHTHQYTPITGYIQFISALEYIRAAILDRRST